MAKIFKGERPKTFKPRIVKFDGPEGEKFAIKVVYRYRTKKEFGEMLDSIGQQAQQAAQSVTEGQDRIWEKMMSDGIEGVADHLVRCIDSWDVDEPVERETFLRLADEMPGGAMALMSEYSAMCRDGRLGN